MSILIIEDDVTLNKNIRESLLAEGFQVESVFDGSLAERMLKKTTYDCVIMDINLPGKSGFELCKTFRIHNTITPVLMLTAFSELEDKVTGFNCGADDYLTKPFFMRELVLRIHSLIKRRKLADNASENSAVMVAGDITINYATKKVFKQNSEVILTPREFQILVQLCEKEGEIVSKSHLIKEIWGSSVDINTNTIEVYINFLRGKIDKPFGTNRIKTKIGYGYYLDS
ncbi:MAG: response regulator transcription factor [Chitinophagaceae bacterium]